MIKASILWRLCFFMKEIIAFFSFILLFYCSEGQELYVYSEPASNMPTNSISTKLSANLGDNYGAFQQRYTPEVMFGFSKKVMVHAGTSFSNMNTANIKWESVFLYGKYRFLSKDDVHK